LIKRYDEIGLKASQKLALKFLTANSLGFMAGQRSRLTVLDIDTTNEAILADALSRHGPTPFIVRTFSGKHHAYYRHDGEPRLIRPWGPDLPIDVLGGGMVVAPPSQSEKGSYRIIQGSLEDLSALPVIRGLSEFRHADDKPEKSHSDVGVRNTSLFTHCMTKAHTCKDCDALLDIAIEFNSELRPPLGRLEVTTVVQKAWNYQISGRNFVGKGHIVAIPIVRLMISSCRLLMHLFSSRFCKDIIGEGKCLWLQMPWPRRCREVDGRGSDLQSLAACLRKGEKSNWFGNMG
jgi:Bifunctional DNA primase/polymerase, N-terminal